MGHILGFPKRAFQIRGPFLGFRPKKHFQILGSIDGFPRNRFKSLGHFRVSHETVSNPWVIFRVSHETISNPWVIFRVSHETISNPWDSLLWMRGKLRTCASLDMKWNHSFASFILVWNFFSCFWLHPQEVEEIIPKERERERGIGSVLKGKVQ